MLIDTHAHVNFSAYKDDGEEVLKRALAEGVFVVNVGSQYSTSKRAVEYAHIFDKGACPHTKDNLEKNLNIICDVCGNKNFGVGVYAAIGIHPVHLKKGNFTHRDPEELEEVEIPTTGEQFEYEKYLELAKDEKVVAIGEIGLDYHHFDPPRASLAESRRVDEQSSLRVEAGEGDDIEELKKIQKETLIKFIQLANEVQKPVMLHCWDGYEDLLEILQSNPVDKRGVVHSFIGSYKTARKFIELGYAIGLNGIITYGESYDRLIKEISLENIVLETDCPYLTPRPLERGMRNQPLFVKEVAKKIASVKNISVEEVEKITTQNAKTILHI